MCLSRLWVIPEKSTAPPGLKRWLTLLFSSGMSVNGIPLFIQSTLSPPLLSHPFMVLAGSEDLWHFREAARCRDGMLFFQEPTVCCSEAGIITVLEGNYGIQMAALMWCQVSPWSATRGMLVWADSKQVGYSFRQVCLYQTLYSGFGAEWGLVLFHLLHTSCLSLICYMHFDNWFHLMSIGKT